LANQKSSCSGWTPRTRLWIAHIRQAFSSGAVNVSLPRRTVFDDLLPVVSGCESLAIDRPFGYVA
jgi:hypothetical protein